MGNSTDKKPTNREKSPPEIEHRPEKFEKKILLAPFPSRFSQMKKNAKNF